MNFKPVASGLASESSRKVHNHPVCPGYLCNNGEMSLV